MSEEDKKESVFGIMDDLLSHLNRTKKLFMAPVVSSFIVAPLAIMLSILIFTPPSLTGFGQKQDVVLSVAEAGVFEAAPAGSMPGRAVMVRVMPGEEVTTLNATGLREFGAGSFVIDESQVQVEFMPAGVARVQVFEAPPLPPRFIYVGSTPAGAPFDVTWVIVAVIAVAVAMAGVWLFIGVKEYRFFSNWNRRYSNYKMMQEKVDKELGDSV